jgi:protein O-GlcNAc transferase
LVSKVPNAAETIVSQFLEVTAMPSWVTLEIIDSDVLWRMTRRKLRLSVTILVLLMVGLTRSKAQDDFTGLSTRAAAARDSTDPATAIPLYEAALKIKPDWMEGLWMAGSLLYGADQYQSAAGYLAHLTSLAPEAAQSWALLGLCEYETESFKSALEHMNLATSLGLEKQPQMMLVLEFHEAAVLTKLGRFDDALQKYSSFFDSRVSDQQVLVGLGLLSLRRPLAPAEVPPADHDLYLNAGAAFAAMLANDQTKARQLYGDLVQRFPDNPNVHYAYGYFLFGTDADAAIAQWNTALVLDPANLGAHTLLAWAFCLRGEQQPAINHAEAALAKNPDEAVPQLVLGRELVVSGHVDDGLAHIEQAVHLQPANLEAHLALASAYSEAGRKADARKERELCMQMQAERRHAQ